jgi:hypothetical protein
MKMMPLLPHLRSGAIDPGRFVNFRQGLAGKVVGGGGAGGSNGVEIATGRCMMSSATGGDYAGAVHRVLLSGKQGRHSRRQVTIGPKTRRGWIG